MEINQCDGCRAGIPLDKNGYHRMGLHPEIYADLMFCQAKKYTRARADASMMPMEGAVGETAMSFYRQAHDLPPEPAPVDSPWQRFKFWLMRRCLI